MTFASISEKDTNKLADDLIKSLKTLKQLKIDGVKSVPEPVLFDALDVIERVADACSKEIETLTNQRDNLMAMNRDLIKMLNSKSPSRGKDCGV